MKKQSELIKERLQNVMLSDRGSGTENLLIALKSDLTELLKSYMCVDGGGVNVSLQASGDGGFEFCAKARADRLFDIGKMID